MLGKRCTDVYGHHAMKKDLGRLARELDVDEEELEGRSYNMLDCLLQEHAALYPSSQSGLLNCAAYGLLLCMRQDGTLISCETLAVRYIEPNMQWPFVAILHEDVTDAVPVKRLLEEATSADQFQKFNAKQKAKMLQQRGGQTSYKAGKSCLEELAFNEWAHIMVTAMNRRECWP